MNKNILIIDDDINDCDIYSAYLNNSSKYEYDIKIANNGTDGLNLIESLTPDCVILDFMLFTAGKVGHGLEVLEKITLGNDTIPVIFLTGYSDEAVHEGSLAMGAKYSLRKQDLNENILVSAVEEIIATKAVAA